MFTDDYIVLRRESGKAKYAPPPGKRSFGTDRAPEGVDNTSLEFVDGLDRRDVAELALDPTVEDFAPVLPLTLHEPVGNSTADQTASPDTGTTWGVAAIGADRSPDRAKG